MTDTKNEQPWYSKFSDKKNHSRRPEHKPHYTSSAMYPQDKKTGSQQFPKSCSLAKVLVQEPLFSPDRVPAVSKKILAEFDTFIQNVRPLNSRQFQQLSSDIRMLSHELTDERGNRRVGYMNETRRLSSYVRYYTWWNLIRLTRLFANLSTAAISLTDGDFCLDIGSGPLTVPIALWLARPELRRKKITWYCMDISAASLSLGEDLYLSIAAHTIEDKINHTDLQAYWKIIRIKGALGTKLKNKVAFVSCANMFNELFQNSDRPPDYLAKYWAESMLAYAAAPASVFVADPGIPSSARLISLLRDVFLRKNMHIIAPCPHTAACPMDGKRGGKWCNFAFSTKDAPRRLLHLSEQAGIPKERAVISFILAATKSEETTEISPDKLLLRITSDPLKLPFRQTGFYACTEFGLVLAVDKTERLIKSGDCITISRPPSITALPIDPKTGAPVIFI
jgi:hypothetical protein